MNGNEDVHLPSEAFEPRRERVTVDVGAFVQHNDTVYRITQVLDFECVIGVSVETGRSVPLAVRDLRPIAGTKDAKLSVAQDLAEIADDDWQIAQQRFAAIWPLVGKFQFGRAEVERRAKEFNVSPATLYRWLQRYNAYGTVTALIPKKRGWQEGKSRIHPDADAVIEQTIKDYYLTAQRPTAKKTITEVLRRCAERGINPPSHMTIRSRIASVSEKGRLRGF